MPSKSKLQISVRDAAHRLLNISVNRREVADAMQGISYDEPINWIAVEYELQLLRIVAVGWALSYLAASMPAKKELSETYWSGIRTFSTALSSMTTPAVGHPVDYFGTVRDRLGQYVKALEHFPDVEDPGRVIGPMFAKLCGVEANAGVIHMGSRMFKRSLGQVQEYLAKVEVE